jgi:beta-lactamase regulating signal transducer with metallopeptidase domain/biopolymer transport protein ExbD
MEQFAQFCRVSAESLAPLIFDTTIKATLLLFLAVIITNLCARNSASLRHQIWLLAVVGVLLLPIISLSLPAWRILPGWPVLRMEVPTPMLPTDDLKPSLYAAATVAKEPASPGSSAPPSVGKRIVFYSTAIWAAGAVLVFIRLATGVVLLRLSIRRTQPATEPFIIHAFEAECAKLNLHDISLRIDHRRRVPFVCGFFRPSVILPANCTTWTESELKAVLRHELAHIKRRDIVALALCSLACILHWFNPLLWFAIRELHIEAEQSCDDSVLSTDIDQADYATQLVTASWFAQESDMPSLAITRRSQLERRVRSALESKRSRSGISVVEQLVTASFALLIIPPLALAQPHHQANQVLTQVEAALPISPRASKATEALSFTAHIAIEFQADGTISLTLDQFNLPDVSRALSQIADRKPRSLVFIRHTGRTNHAAVVHAARLCRKAGLRCTFVSNFTDDPSPQLPPEFQALPSKARLVSLNVDSAGKFALRAHGFSNADLLATLAELRLPASRVVMGSKDLFREFANMQLAVRALAAEQ